jgi:hypothetical protein
MSATLTCLPKIVLSDCISQWLFLKEFILFDTSITERTLRYFYMNLTPFMVVSWDEFILNSYDKSHNMRLKLKFVSSRALKLSCLNLTNAVFNGIYNIQNILFNQFKIDLFKIMKIVIHLTLLNYPANQTLSSFLYNFPSLNDLTLSHSNLLHDKDFTNMMPIISKLSTLHLIEVGNKFSFTNLAWKMISETTTQTLKNIELDFSNCSLDLKLLQVYTLSEFIQTHHNILILHIFSNTIVTIKTIEKIHIHMKLIKSIKFTKVLSCFCTIATLHSLLVNSLPFLEHITFSHDNIDEINNDLQIKQRKCNFRHFEYINLIKYKSINICGVKLFTKHTEIDLFIGDTKNYDHITIRNITDMNRLNNMICLLNSNPNLKSISIYDCGTDTTSQDLIDMIYNHQCIRKICLCGYDYDNLTGLFDTSKLYQFIAQQADKRIINCILLV